MFERTNRRARQRNVLLSTLVVPRDRLGAVPRDWLGAVPRDRLGAVRGLAGEARLRDY